MLCTSDSEKLSGAEEHRTGMLKQSENIVHRLFHRQISRPRPNTHIHQARTLYENIVPSHTVYDVECPDHNFRKFTNDGQFLICFGRNHQELVVYRHKWLNFCVKGEDCDQPLDLPPKARRFESHFSLLYTIPLATGTEAICKDFFLSAENGLYGIFATTTVPDNSNPATDGAVPGVPSTEKITIFIVSLAEGRITDQRAFRDDFIQLAHNMGVFLYDDLLAILSIRFQCIRILQIRESGRFVDVRTIGTHCREDDELVLNSQAQEEELYHKQLAYLRKARGLSQHDASVSGKVGEPGKPWPLLWNVKQGQSTRRERNRRHAPSSAHGSNGVVAGHRSENGHGGSADPEANGNHSEIQDLDLQYENYFRGLLATLEDTAVNEVNGHVSSNGNGSTSSLQGGMNLARQRSGVGLPAVESHSQSALSNGHHHGGGGDHPHQNGVVVSSQFSGERTGPALPTSWRQNSVAAEHRTAYAPLVSIYDNVRAARNSEGSTSTSGGHYSSAGPSRYGRSYTSTSGSSLDRYTSGRGSSSVRYTSTTISSGSSDSRSEGSLRDASFSGVSMSYGSGRPAANGSLSVRSENGTFVEYVVSSRMQGAGTVTTTQQIPLAEHLTLPSSSFQGGSERRTSDRTLRENGQDFPGDGGTSMENGVHSHETTDEPTSDDRTLPLRPAERSISLSTTGDVQIGGTRRAPLSVRENNNNGNRGRPPRNGEHGAAQRSRPVADVATDSNEGGGAQVLGGIKQRLLSFIFQGVVNEDISPIAKAQRLKRFYYHFQHYVDLVMWKVQFLDRYHLLIKFGSVDGVLQRNSDTSHQTAFLAIFNLETTEILGFYQNSSEEFLLSFEQFCDHFRVAPRYPLYMNFISSYSNNSHVRDQLRKQRTTCSSSKTGNYLQFVKRTLAWVPFNSQCQSPSAYYDQSLFHYDEKLISAIDRHKPCMEHPIKFLSRRRPNCLKFKLSPGPEHGANDGRTKRVASFIFHPIFPFAISIQQSFMQPSVINFHFRK
ncbi:unnamed protein product [Calypogeia fissa]